MRTFVKNGSPEALLTRADLFAKYDVPVPRYTSYPTVPQWHHTPSADEWHSSMTSALEGSDTSIAVYVHIPFCESLCTFCGCNTVITRDHGREGAYVDLVLAELDLYLRAVPALAGAPVRQLHLGGGTPTFLSAQLARQSGGWAACEVCRPMATSSKDRSRWIRGSRTSRISRRFGAAASGGSRSAFRISIPRSNVWSTARSRCR